MLCSFSREVDPIAARVKLVSYEASQEPRYSPC